MFLFLKTDIKIAASHWRCGDFSFGLFAVLALFALLIGDTAGGFACGLAGGLTFTATAFRSGYRKVSCFQSRNSLHFLHLLSCGFIPYYYISPTRVLSRKEVQFAKAFFFLIWALGAVLKIFVFCDKNLHCSVSSIAI